MQRVLVPTDLSRKSQKLIQDIKKWSDQLQLTIGYLYVKPEVFPYINYPNYRAMVEVIQSRVKESFQSFKKEIPDISVKTIISGDVAGTISEIGGKYDFIAMIPHTRSGLIPQFGRVTAKVIRLSDRPVLVIKN